MSLYIKPHSLSPLQFISLMLNPSSVLEYYANRYGDPFAVKWANLPPFVLISNPKHINELFTINPELFEVSKATKILQPLLGSHSLVLLDGDRHQQERRLLSPAFHRERIQAYGEIICRITEQVISQLVGSSFPVRSPVQEITLLVILQTVFGITKEQNLQKFKQAIESVLESISSPLTSGLLFFTALQKDLGAWSPWGNYLVQQKLLDKLIYTEIQSRRQQVSQGVISNTQTDILALLMSVSDEEGQTLSNVELRDELLTLLIAGHETTATAVIWALYWICYLPEVYHKVLEEIDKLDKNLDPSRISQLPYLNAVCQEVLRMHPVGLSAMPRILKVPLELIGYQFEAGTFLVPCIYLTHQRHDLYPQPKQFKPERFLERQFSPYEYYPFGGGNRRCIGMAFAQYEMKMIIATVLSQFKLALVDKKRLARPVRRGVTLAPPANICMVVTEKR